MQDGSTFRALCAEHGIAVTHQRQVLYETMQGMHGHPSPEEVYASVKERIPSISLATVYKNIHLFVQSGVLRELSMHHGTLRVETNKDPAPPPGMQRVQAGDGRGAGRAGDG